MTRKPKIVAVDAADPDVTVQVIPFEDRGVTYAEVMGRALDAEKPDLWVLADEIEALPFKARAAQLPRIIRAIAEVLK
jgi:hypothetical protein